MELRCANCEAKVPEGAPFCVVCGRDPLLGTPWPDTATLPRDDEGNVSFDGADAASLTADELSQLAVFHAWCVGLLENDAAKALVDEPGRFNLVARRRRRQKLPGQMMATHLQLAHTVDVLRLTLQALATGCREQGMEYETFIAAFPGPTWVAHALDCYLSAAGLAGLVDVFERRLARIVASRGAEHPVSVVGESRRYEFVLNGWMLQRGADALEEVATDTEVVSGYGELVDVLVPAAWRFWRDVGMAPTVALLVYEQPRAAAGLGVADPTWEGDRRLACSAYRAYVCERRVRDIEVAACEVGGLPAVRATGLLGPDGHAAAVEYLWVNAGDRIFYVHTAAPQAAPDYVRAVRDALESFRVAA